jgi:hypothetical protein
MPHCLGIFDYGFRVLIVEQNPHIRINCGIFGLHNFTINEKSL